jgi:hypothetical protein
MQILYIKARDVQGVSRPFSLAVGLYKWTVPNFLGSCYYVPPGPSHGMDSTRSFQIGPLLWSCA